MKIRSSFVANSSSSSFIIAVKDFSKIEISPEWIQPMIKKVFNKLLNGDQYSDIVKLNEYFKDRYLSRNATDEDLKEALQEDEYLKSLYDRCIESINKGYIVVFKEVDYHDETTTEIFESLPTEADDNGIYLLRSEN
jgi:hypothetical protein